MAYEFELLMRDLAVDALKKAYKSFLIGDSEAYYCRMDEAVSAIDGIERLGISAGNPRFLWVSRLNCDWKLVDSFRELKNLETLCKIYNSCYFEPYPSSLVLKEETPYLPYDCNDVFEFYGMPLEEAEYFSEKLSKVLDIYGRMTGGGGKGVVDLYKAGAEFRKGQYLKAWELACHAQKVGGKWIGIHTRALFQKIGKEKLQSIC